MPSVYDTSGLTVSEYGSGRMTVVVVVVVVVVAVVVVVVVVVVL